MANNQTLRERMARVEQKLEDLTQRVEEGFSSLRAQLAKLDKRFAPKWVEWAVKVIIGGLITAIIGAIAYWFK